MVETDYTPHGVNLTEMVESTLIGVQNGVLPQKRSFDFTTGVNYPQCGIKQLTMHVLWGQF